MTKVLRYLKKYWCFALLTPLFMVLEVSMDLVQPSLMSRIVDEGIVAGDIQLILNLGGQMLIFTVIGCLGGVLSGVFGTPIAGYQTHESRTLHARHKRHLYGNRPFSVTFAVQARYGVTRHQFWREEIQ